MEDDSEPTNINIFVHHPSDDIDLDADDPDVGSLDGTLKTAKEPPLSLTIARTRSVQEMGALLHSQCGVDVSSVRFLFGGLELKPTCILKEVGIDNSSNIHMVRRLLFKREGSLELRKQKARGELERDREQESFERKTYEKMLKWLEDADGKFRGTVRRLGNVMSYDLGGLVCTKNMKEGEVLIDCPLQCIITSEIAQASEIGSRIRGSALELRSKHTFIASFLLQEKRDPRSYWKPYIDLLRVPSEYNKMPIFYDAELLGYLEGSRVLDIIADRKSSLKAEYDQLCAAVPEYQAFSFEEFIWARIVVVTRIFGFHVGGIKTDGLVPLVDTIQHGARVCSWAMKDERFMVEAMQDMQEGEAVSISFGSKCNSRWLVNYGISVTTPDQASKNTARVTFRPLPEHENLKCVKSYLSMDPQGGPTEVMLQGDCAQFIVGTNHHAGFNPLQVHVMIATARHVARALMDPKEAGYPEWESVDFSQGNKVYTVEHETKTFEILKSAVENSLSLYSTTLEEDQALLDLTDSPASRLALKQLLYQGTGMQMAMCELVASYWLECTDIRIRNIYALRMGEKAVLRILLADIERALKSLKEGTSVPIPSGDAVVIAFYNPFCQWTCSMCTLLNKPEDEECEVCGSIRDSVDEENDGSQH